VSEWLLPAGVAIAALALTYLFCLRPMRRGYCSAGTNRVAGGAEAGHTEDSDRALRHARTELARLRAEDGPLTSSHETTQRSAHFHRRTTR